MRLWRRWVARLDHREPATPLAAFRVAIGVCVLLTLLPMTGVLELVLTDAAFGGYRKLPGRYWLVEALGGATPEVAWGLWGVGALGGLGLVVGLGGRATALLTGQALMALFSLNPEAGGGHDKLLENALWLLVLSPATATFSLDCRIRTGRWVSHSPRVAWPRYVIVFQLVLVYFTTGLQKLSPVWLPWGDFSAVYYAVQLPSWQRFDMSWVASVYPLTQLATVVSWTFEMSSPLWLLAFWFRATRDRPGRLRRWFNRLDVRAIYAAVGLGFHLGIWAVMNLGPFSWVTLSFYLALFHHDEYAAAWGRIRGRGAVPGAEASAG